MTPAEHQAPNTQSIDDWVAHTRTCMQSEAARSTVMLIPGICSTLEEDQQRRFFNKLLAQTPPEHQAMTQELIIELDRQLWFMKMADRFTQLVEEIEGYRATTKALSIQAKRWFVEAELIRQDQD